MPAYHMCLASCLIHRFGGCCPHSRCNQAAMSCINIELMLPKIFPALLPSTSQTICRQKISHTPSVNMCHVHLTPLSSCKVFVFFCPKNCHLCCQNEITNFRLNFCHAKLPPPLPPKYGCLHFCHHILPSNLLPTLHCH